MHEISSRCSYPFEYRYYLLRENIKQGFLIIRVLGNPYIIPKSLSNMLYFMCSKYRFLHVGEHMKIYITMVGLSDWAIFNSLWAAIRLRNYVPDKIYIFTITKRRKQAELARRRFHALLKEYGKKAKIDIIEVAEADFVSSGKRINEVVKEEKTNENKIAIEVTPGRKAMVAGALVPSIQGKVDHVFYLYLENFDYSDNLFMRIPLTIQHSHDFMEEVRFAGK